ncbi:MAG: hypothetical protein AB1405_11910 [Bdellovibrionota bacterium]
MDTGGGRQKPGSQSLGSGPSAGQTSGNSPEREEFDRVFGKGPVPKAMVQDILKTFRYAGEEDRESRIFSEAPSPGTRPAARPQIPRLRPPQTDLGSIEPINHMEARRRINQAQTVDEVTHAFLGYARSLFSRVALLVSRAPYLLGWDAAGGSWKRDAIRQIAIPLSEPSIFRLFETSAGYYLGPIPKTPVNDQFVRSTGGARPKSCLIVPVLVGKRVVNVLYGDNGHASEAGGDFSELLLFVLTVGGAYERLIRSQGKAGASSGERP